jgi:hypothetical protein
MKDGLAAIVLRHGDIRTQNVKLNTFVETFISQAIIGMLKSLRGVDVIETIDLKISKN